MPLGMLGPVQVQLGRAMGRRGMVRRAAPVTPFSHGGESRGHGERSRQQDCRAGSTRVVISGSELAGATSVPFGSVSTTAMMVNKDGTQGDHHVATSLGGDRRRHRDHPGRHQCHQ